ncbi:hypothetical protein LTR54_001178 [Friedmanniomyces endolithicus]|uniref:Major facilitator superfamily (MFS) profile domain-containing protein n=1 Tax=Friedmanniomyces endolithicus TaxID=329885 RepID=A0AAN6FTM7_9PEZI|nr:hypothetical protein LTR82_006544 [Friedmanniomyces endolithicus]KAK1018292.1 hypothetical protein LTR54_001178 [Friedmanniomyces endolithicus]
MGLFKRSAPHADDITPSASPTSVPIHEKDADITHAETASAVEHHAKWKVSKAGDGDAAMALFNSPDEIHEPIDPAEEARVVRKIDLMILPYLAVCYAFFYIDKTTLSYAAIFGIRKDLDLVGQEYSWLSSIFYFGFLAWALPTNLLMQRLPIGKYLGFNIFLWGVFLMMQSAAKNFAGLAALRAFAGAAEACSDPSFMLITSMCPSGWESGTPPTASASRSEGYSASFEFLIIGALCCIWGVVMFIFLPDSPITAKGLTHREKRIAVERLRHNQTGVENKVPYGCIIAISILTCVFLNDYMGRHGRQTRCWFILLFLCPNIAGSFGLRFLADDNKAGRLVSYYLTGPYNAAFVMILAMTTANTAGHTKKVITNAVLFLGYCTGNIAGPFFYKTRQAPQYPLGIWSMIVSHLTEVVIILILRFHLSRENKRRDRIQSQMVGGLEGRDLDATAFSDMTDRENLNFRYLY